MRATALTLDGTGVTRAARLRKIFNAACALVFVVSVLWSASDGLRFPFKNWDLNAYVGAAISLHTDDAQMLYDETIHVLEDVRTSEQMEEFKTGKLSASPEVFAEQLPLYTIKPLYVSMMVALHGLGIDLVESTFYISGFSFVALALVFALWRPEQLNWGLWLLSFVAISWVGKWPMKMLAQFSTPDALATFFSLLAVYALFKRRLQALFMAAGALAILTRPDAVILMILSVFAAWVAERKANTFTSSRAGLMVGAFAALYCLMKIAIGGYDFTTIFYYSFVEKMPLPGSTPVELSFGKYWELLTRGISKLDYDARVPLFMGFSAFAGACYFMRPLCDKRWLWLMVLAWCGFAARFALYPAWWEFRYNFIFFLIAMMAMAEMAPPYLIALWKRLLAHRTSINN